MLRHVPPHLAETLQGPRGGQDQSAKLLTFQVKV